MLKTLSMIAAMSLVSASALAVDMVQVEKSIALKDGSTVYVFKDGKMGMEDKLGRVMHMKQGHVMETKDGRKIIMTGNEIWRVDELLHSGHRQ
jgi:uncharacterized protein YdeI (BOF family)